MSTNEPHPSGLHVIYGSRTRRGLNHANEDRHAVAVWKDWRIDAHVNQPAGGHGNEVESSIDNVPKPQMVIPLCTGSARKDTTISGSGATGTLSYNCAGLIGGSDGASTPQEGLSSGSGKDGKEEEQTAFLWTVCDGHDGPEAANFVCSKVGEALSRIWHSPASTNLPANLLQGKKLGIGEEGETYARGYALSNALARTFEALDSSFKLIVSEGGQLESCTAGSCVTSIFLSGTLMCCAGLGDCKAAILTLEEADVPVASGGASSSSTGLGAANHKVMDGASTTTTDEGGKPASSSSKATQQFQVTWFSKEHRSSAPKERARIRARGGWFRHGRVGGVLEPTRTIGDFDVKASQPPGVVIATPEVRTFSVIKPALVLVASDGVWDVMDASQLLRTLKKRRRLWRGILSWLGAPLPERRSLMNFGFRRRAKSKEGLEAMLQLPTGGDLCAMADTLVTRAHDLGSDDDCTCVCIYLRPSTHGKTLDGSLKRAGSAEATPDDMDLVVPEDADLNASQPPEEDDEDDEDLEEDDEGEEDEEADKEAAYSPSADSYSEYEKWRNLDSDDGPPPPGADDEETGDGQGESTRGQEDNAWDLSTATFPVSLVATSQGMETLFPSSTIDGQDAPEVIEKAKRRREERRAARERRKKSLDYKASLLLGAERADSQSQPPSDAQLDREQQ